MKLKKQSLLFTLFMLMILCFAVENSFAQNVILDQRLAGKTKLKEIMAEVDNFYRPFVHLDANGKPVNKTLFQEYKRWKRWEWFHSGRLNPDGTIADVVKKELLALDQLGENVMNGGQNNSSLTNSGGWINIGPTNTTAGPNSYLQGIGRCDRIVFHPTDPLTYYICTPTGGLWRTFNDGASWTNLTDGLPSLGISGMVVSYNNPNILYILTGDGDSNIGGFVQNFGYMRLSQGVFKSTDAGYTWQQTGAFPLAPAQFTGFKLVQSPTNSNVLIAATSFGLMKTTNGGLSWENAAPSQPQVKFQDVEFKPGSGSVAYAVANYGNTGTYFFKAGAALIFTVSSYAELPGSNQNANSVNRYAIAVTNANAEHVVLLAGPSISNTGFQGIFRSVNSGVSFTAAANTPNILGISSTGIESGDQASYDHCVAINHTNTERVITGGLCVWGSTDGGATMAAVTKYFEYQTDLIPYIHPDVHDVSYNPLNNYLYACTDGGVFKSTDDGVTFTNLSAGLIVSEYYHMSGMQSDPTKLLGGLQDNGTSYKKTVSTTFTHIGGADGHRTAINSTDANKIYWTENESVFRSTNGGTDKLSAMPITPNAFYPALCLNPSNQNKYYIGTGYANGATQVYKFYHSDNGGSTYIDSTSINVTKDLAAAPSDVNVLYGTDGNLFWRSQNEGYSFVGRSAGLPAGRAITDIAVNPNNADVVVVTLGGFTPGQKLYYSINGGTTWQNLSGTLPNIPINCAAINTNGDIYIGTDLGVFYQAEAENDWRPYYNGLPRVPVTELIIYPTGDLIRAATFGRGVWETSLYTSCSPSLFVTANVTTPKVYNAGNLISSTQNIIGTTGVNVLYRSGGYIEMTPGFKATQGSLMNAVIGPCLPGVFSQGARNFVKPSGALSLPPLTPEFTRKTGKKAIYQ